MCFIYQYKYVHITCMWANCSPGSGGWTVQDGIFNIFFLNKQSRRCLAVCGDRTRYLKPKYDLFLILNRAFAAFLQSKTETKER